MIDVDNDFSWKKFIEEMGGGRGAMVPQPTSMPNVQGMQAMYGLAPTPQQPTPTVGETFAPTNISGAPSREAGGAGKMQAEFKTPDIHIKAPTVQSLGEALQKLGAPKYKEAPPQPQAWKMKQGSQLQTALWGLLAALSPRGAAQVAQGYIGGKQAQDAQAMDAWKQAAGVVADENKQAFDVWQEQGRTEQEIAKQAADKAYKDRDIVIKEQNAEALQGWREEQTRKVAADADAAAIEAERAEELLDQKIKSGATAIKTAEVKLKQLIAKPAVDKAKADAKVKAQKELATLKASQSMALEQYRQAQNNARQRRSFANSFKKAQASGSGGAGVAAKAAKPLPKATYSSNILTAAGGAGLDLPTGTSIFSKYADMFDLSAMGRGTLVPSSAFDQGRFDEMQREFDAATAGVPYIPNQYGILGGAEAMVESIKRVSALK